MGTAEDRSVDKSSSKKETDIKIGAESNSNVSKNLKDVQTDSKSVDEEKTTYWITDEYGIKRKVDKDASLSYTVDDYGHRHYISEDKSKDGITTKNSSTKTTTEEESSENKFWVTDRNGKRQLVTREVRPNNVSSSRKNSTKSTKKISDSSNKDLSKKKNEDDTVTYWITDEYGIKRKVEKDAKLSYTVDKYGHPHYNSDSKNTSEDRTVDKSCSKKQTDIKIVAESNSNVSKNLKDVQTDSKSVDEEKTTYWIT